MSTSDAGVLFTEMVVQITNGLHLAVFNDCREQMAQFNPSIAANVGFQTLFLLVGDGLRMGAQ